MPVLLQHGVLCSSADWVIQSPEKSLGKRVTISIVWVGFLFSCFDLVYDVEKRFWRNKFRALCEDKSVCVVEKGLGGLRFFFLFGEMHERASFGSVRPKVSIENDVFVCSGRQPRQFRSGKK